MAHLENQFPLYDSSDLATEKQLKENCSGNGGDASNPSQPSSGLTTEQVNQMIQAALANYNSMQVYSEEETVIGTYLGKPLYGRVFKCNTPSVSDDIILTLPDYISKVVSRRGVFVEAYGATVFVPMNFYSNGSIDIWIDPNNNVHMFLIREIDKNKSLELYLEYTKSTD